MERVGEWRLIDAEDEPESKPAAPAGQTNGGALGIRLLVLVLGAVVLVSVAAAIWLTLPQGGVELDVSGQSTEVTIDGEGLTDPRTAPAAASLQPDLVVDVQGAVMRPGVHQLPTGSRLGDAITAAGGYSAQVDIAAAAERLNLAERLSDGAKVRVPIRGEQLTAVSSPSGPSQQAAGGLIDVNHATAEELDTLPGVGPVTAQKIIDARTEIPFNTVDELLTRGVVGQATFDKVRDLITVTN